MISIQVQLVDRLPPSTSPPLLTSMLAVRINQFSVVVMFSARQRSVTRVAFTDRSKVLDET